MELNPKAADGDMHSPGQVMRQVEDARQKAEYFESQRAQWEAQRQELEESTVQKNLFNEKLNELGMKIHNAVRRLEAEQESMNRESATIAQICDTLKRHLQILSALQPQNWSTEGFQQRLLEAIPRLERAENDFDEAYMRCSKFIHTDTFKHKPGVREKEGIQWVKVKEQMTYGLVFHLPLFLLILISWGIYKLSTL